MTEEERLRMENEELKGEVDRLKDWNRRFYERVHYYFFEALAPWKAAAPYSEQKRKLTAKCRSIEDQITRELERVDKAVSKRNSDTPADADKPTAVQAELGL